MSFNSNYSSSPGYPDTELADIDEDLDIVKVEGDQVLHLNYRGLLEVPGKLISEAHEFQHITRIYLKRNKLTTLVCTVYMSVARSIMSPFTKRQS